MAVSIDHELDIRHLAGCYSMDVIAKCCFATDTNSFDDPNDPFVKYTKDFFQVTKWRRFARIFLPNWIKRSIGFTTNPKHSLDFLTHVARKVLDQRLTSGQQSVDYLQLLIDASTDGHGNKIKDTVPDHESHHGYEDESTAMKLTNVRRPLTTDEIIANSVLFLAVGYDTTSLLITFVIYSLTVDDNVQNKLFSKLSQAYKSVGHKLTYETISGLKYLDAVISETLRLYPSATMIERKVLDDYQFSGCDGKGIKVTKGSSVWLPIWNIHRDPRFWKDPLQFDPERFLPENRDKIVPYSYIPFGAGPRNCIGMRFALLEAKLAIANLVLNFKFTPCPSTDIPVDLSPTLGVLGPKRVIVNVSRRAVS